MLEKVYNQLKKIKTINQGGCAIAALAVVRRLAVLNFKHLDDLRIVFFFDEIDKKEKKGKIYNRLPRHVCIKVDDEYYDTRGQLTGEHLAEIKVEITVEEVQYLIQIINIYESKLGDYWRPNFVRTKELPKIEKMFKISLHDVDCQEGL